MSKLDKYVLKKIDEICEFPFSATLFIETEKNKAWERDWTCVCLDGAAKMFLPIQIILLLFLLVSKLFTKK